MLPLLVLSVVACRPASYDKDVKVMVPRSPPSDGPDAPAPAPRTRALYPGQDVVVKVPSDQALPRGIKADTSND